MKTIIQLCADTGSDTMFYRKNGYNVILVGSDIGVENYHPPADTYGIIANPVCTEFSTARSDGKARDPEAGMFLVKECQRIISECNPTFWVIENPATGALKNYLGKPDYVYQPWWYGSPWTKKTALWGKFNIPPRIYYKWEDVPKIPELYVRKSTHGRKVLVPKPGLAWLHKSSYHLIPEFQDLPVPDSDMEFRSLCSQRFARYFFDCNP